MRGDQALDLTDGPWSQMLDSIAPTSRRRGAYLLGQNIYPLDPAIGDGVVGRPGVRVLGAQLGAPGARRGQGTYQFTKKNGTEYTVQVTGGRFYTLTWGTETWTEVLTAAQLAAAGIALSATARVAFLTYSDKLMVSDGVNLPWLWDGTTGGGLTKMTNCPVLYGQPTVYNARIFGIKAADPSTFVWSETDSPNTGYEAGGFNNSWTLTQTDPNRLYALVGQNDAVTALRARSGTLISGDVTSNFSSTGTKDALSGSIGTASPFAVVVQDVNLLLLDADLHPQLVRPGGAGFSPVWANLRETLKKVPKTAASAEKCIGVYYSPAQLVLFAVPDIGQTECTMCLVYDVKGEPVPVGVWRGWEMTTLAMVKDGTGAPYLLHADTLGYVYLHGNPEDSGPWDDFLSTGTVPIAHVLELQALGYSAKDEKIFDRIDVAIRALTRMTLDVSYTTPRGQTPAQRIVVDSGIAGWDNALWDLMTWDVDVSLSTQEAHGDVGIDAEARWIKPKLSHAMLNEQFGVVGVSVAAFGTDDDPEVP